MSLHMWPDAWKSKSAPSLGRRSENGVLPLTELATVISQVFTVVFVATTFIARNFHSPTAVEKWLWRGTSCDLMALVMVGSLSLDIFLGDRAINSAQAAARKHSLTLDDFKRSKKTSRWDFRLKLRLKACGMKIRNNSADQDPNLDMSATVAISATLAFALYSVCRVYVLVEDVIALRALPLDAYKTVEWWSFMPHIG